MATEFRPALAPARSLLLTRPRPVLPTMSTAVVRHSTAHAPPRRAPCLVVLLAYAVVVATAQPASAWFGPPVVRSVVEAELAFSAILDEDESLPERTDRSGTSTASPGSRPIRSSDEVPPPEEIGPHSFAPPGFAPPGFSPPGVAPPVVDCGSPCCQRCGGSLWVVSTRSAAPCPPRADSLDCLVAWQCVPGEGWVERSIEQFLATDDPAVPTVIYVHGNNHEHAEAVEMGQMIYRRVLGCCGVRFVVWSWPAQRLKFNRVDDFRIKSSRSEAQGYYLAWFVDRLNPAVPVALAGHSFGARTVTSSLAGLATGQVAGQPLPERVHPGPRYVRAVLMCAAMDADLLAPGRSHAPALTQVDEMVVLRNMRDRVLHFYPWISPSRTDALGVVGLPPAAWTALAAERVREVSIEPYMGVKHTWTMFVESPALAARLRQVLLGGQGAHVEVR